MTFLTIHTRTVLILILITFIRDIFQSPSNSHSLLIAAQPNAQSLPPIDSQAVDEKPVSFASAPSCSSRYLLYSIQGGEGFSLRRDVFVRMSLALLESPDHQSSPWSLILPPLSSRVSPHWEQGIQHDGIRYYERAIPWRSLFDIDAITRETGLNFIEYEEWVHHQLEASQVDVEPVFNQMTPVVDRLIHLCHFHYNEHFHAEQNAARLANQLYPRSHNPRHQLFDEFSCINGAQPNATKGFCSNRLGQIIDRRTSANLGDHDAILVNDYGLVRLRDGKEKSIVCGLSNMPTTIVGSILDELMMTTATTPTSDESQSHSQSQPGPRPICTVAMTNVQLIYWPSRPHPQSRDTTEPNYVTHHMRDRFLRAARLAEPLRQLVHLYIAVVLESQPAILPSDDPTSAALFSTAPSIGYLSFHIRRGDFMRVHSSVVPDFDSLIRQMRDRFKSIEAKQLAQSNSNSRNALSPHLFIASDMSTKEWTEVERRMETMESKEKLGLTLHRFDITQVVTQLRPYFSSQLAAYVDGALDAAKKAKSLSSSDSSSASSAIPFTPFHILLMDQYLCEQSLRFDGFLGTRHSYVSEMVWNHRRAWELEEKSKWEKDTFRGVEPPTTNNKEEL